MRIGIDAMGGDYAPDVVVDGAIEALKRVHSETIIVLYGDQTMIKNRLQGRTYDPEKLQIVHTTQVIDMGDHPAKAFQQKTDSSITVGFAHLKAGQIEGFASAGSTGAMMVGSMLVIGQIPGVIRPTICTPIATTGQNPFVLLDAGLNADCKPEVLNQYATIGSIYAEQVLGIEKPRVALLNIGEEAEKGNLLTKATYPLMAENKNINFVGNVEANHLYDCSKADVVVCDGFAGNTILKQTEGVYALMKKTGAQNQWLDKLNYELVGGTPVLGVEKTVVIGHGRSSALAIENMILSTEKTALAAIPEKLAAALN